MYYYPVSKTNPLLPSHLFSNHSLVMQNGRFEDAQSNAHTRALHQRGMTGLQNRIQQTRRLLAAAVFRFFSSSLEQQSSAAVFGTTSTLFAVPLCIQCWTLYPMLDPQNRITYNNSSTLFAVPRPMECYPMLDLNSECSAQADNLRTYSYSNCRSSSLTPSRSGTVQVNTVTIITAPPEARSSSRHRTAHHKLIGEQRKLRGGAR